VNQPGPRRQVRHAHGRRWGRFPAAAAVTVLGLLATAALAACGGAKKPTPPAPAPVAVTHPATSGTPLPVPADTPVPAGTSAPTRIRIPDIGVDAGLEPLHLLPDGTLDPPNKFEDAGWYADGTRPGDTGPAVIAGHIDSKTGPAVFFKLDKLHPGAVIEVNRDGRWVAFRVISTGKYPKNKFPTAQVYGPTPDAQLRLITCGGVFDTVHNAYLDNTVVYAVAA
jgi:hypothetical protein